MPDLRYTQRDYEAILGQMKADAPAKAPELTNFNQGEFAIALMELEAHGLDVLSYSLDTNALEAYLDTAVAKPNVQNILRALGYEMRRRRAATATLTLELSSPYGGGPITIPMGTTFATASGTPYVLLDDVVIPTNATTIVVTVYQGTYRVDGPYGSSGLPAQTVRLAYTDVSDNFFKVLVNGVLWTEEKFVTPYPTLLTTIYRARENIDNSVDVLFSKYLGEAPAGGQPIEVRYLSTLGVGGNIGSGLITTVVSALSLPGGRTLAITASSAATGGLERESVQEAKVNGPRSLRSLERVVTLQDIIDRLKMNSLVESVNVINHAGYVEGYVRLVGDPYPVFKVEPPYLASAVESAGGSISAGTYYVAVTSVDVNGRETNYRRIATSTGVVLQNPATVVVTGASKKIIVELADLPVGAVTFNVYVGASPDLMYQYATGVTPGSIVSTPYDITTIPSPGTVAPTSNNAGEQGTDGTSVYQNLWSDIEARRILCTFFELFDTEPVAFNVTLTVYARDAYRRSDVQTAVESALAAYFTARDIGAPLYKSDLESYLIANLSAIRNVQVTAPSGDTGLGVNEYAVLGTTTVTVVGGIA